jgi:hypothetical protein
MFYYIYIIILIIIIYVFYRMKRNYTFDQINTMTKGEFIEFIKMKKIDKLNLNDVKYVNTIKNINIYSGKILIMEYGIYDILSRELNKGNTIYNKKKFYINPCFKKNEYEKYIDENTIKVKFDNDILLFKYNIPEPINKLLWKSISLKEFNDSLREGQTKIDMIGISKNILGDLPQIIKNQIIDKYNEIIENNDVIDHNIGKGSFIYKTAKKGALTDVKSFRQVVGIPAFVSHLHRILSLRLSDYIITNNYLDTTIQKCGMTGIKLQMFEQIVKVKNIIKNANNKKKELSILFVDISDAYPSLNINKLCQVLKKYKVDNNIIRYINKFYDNFTYYLTTKTWKSKNMIWNRGLLQGCPMSSVLFVVVLNYILKYIECKLFDECAYELSDSKKVLFVAYMDDIAITCKDTLSMNKIFLELEKILKEFNLSINRAKTCYMEINKVKKEEYTELKIDLLKVDKYKYLGEYIYCTGSSLNSFRGFIMQVKAKLEWFNNNKTITNEAKVLFVTSTLMPVIQRKFLTLYDIGEREKIGILNIVKVFTEKWDIKKEILCDYINVDLKEMLKNTTDTVLKNLEYEDNIYNIKDEEERKVTKVKLSEIFFEYNNIEKDEAVLKVE